MTDRPRRRYRVRLRTALAGSVFAASVSLAGTASSALAVPSTASATYLLTSDDDDGGAAETAGAVSPRGGVELDDGATSSSPSERLAAIRGELDHAVLLQLVTSEQADSFYLQLERRVAAGL